jgi:hypothetical protein
VVVIVYVTYHLLFTYSTLKGFPRGMWSWLSITAPHLFWDTETITDTTRMQVAPSRAASWHSSTCKHTAAVAAAVTADTAAAAAAVAQP